MTEDWFFARRHIRPDELINMREVAKLTSLSYNYIRELRIGREKTKPPFPDPDVIFGRSPLWKRKTIADWVYLRDIRRRNTGHPQIRTVASDADASV